MSPPRVAYAHLPEADRIVAMYLAAAPVASITGESGFSPFKIRKILRAREVKLRTVGRPGSGDKPADKPLPVEITPEWHASRGTCWNCGARLDHGCPHHPLVAVHALEVETRQLSPVNIIGPVNHRICA